MTSDQRRILEQLEHGFVWEWHKDPQQDDVLRYLMDKGLCRAREDIRPGWLELTEAGKKLLRELREQEAAQSQKQAAEEAAEAKRLQERHEDNANAERRYRTQNKISVIMPLITFVLGLLVEHFAGVIRLVLSLFE